MPKSYTSSSEARSALLQQSKKWREDFKALKEKSKKVEEQALIKTVDEFLGQFLSTITGVPSAQDHRKVIEMLWAIKSRSDGFEKLLKTSARLNDQILNSLHLHDKKFTLFREQIKAFDQAIGSNTEMIGKTIMSLSILAKLHVSNSAINATLSRAEQIMGKGDIKPGRIK